MNLSDFLTLIGNDLGLDPATLIEYASEDTIGGYHSDSAQSKWPVGSLWAVDGQALYALVRALRPTAVLELGAHRGASTTHIATALQANGGGKVYSVDIMGNAGDLVPVELYPYIEFVRKAAIEYLNATRRRFDFAFEDMMHSAEQVLAVCGELQTRMDTGSLILHHDSEHFLVGSDVRAGMEAAGVAWQSALIEPADTGLAWWRV